MEDPRPSVRELLKNTIPFPFNGYGKAAVKICHICVPMPLNIRLPCSASMGRANVSTTGAM